MSVNLIITIKMIIITADFVCALGFLRYLLRAARLNDFSKF